jgi:hypothetical protein
MKTAFMVALFCCSSFAFAQTSGDSSSTENQHKVSGHKSPSAKHDIGSGAGDVGKGVGKGAGSAAKGAGKGAADLVTLHPIDAATDLGKGAVGTGKNVGVGAAKGTGKIVRGTGKVFKHIF